MSILLLSVGLFFVVAALTTNSRTASSPNHAVLPTLTPASDEPASGEPTEEPTSGGPEYLSPADWQTAVKELDNCAGDLAKAVRDAVNPDVAAGARALHDLAETDASSLESVKLRSTKVMSDFGDKLRALSTLAVDEDDIVAQVDIQNAIGQLDNAKQVVASRVDPSDATAIVEPPKPIDTALLVVGVVTALTGIMTVLLAWTGPRPFALASPLPGPQPPRKKR